MPWCVVNANVVAEENDTKEGSQEGARVPVWEVSRVETRACGRFVATLGEQCGRRLQAQASVGWHPKQGRQMRH